MAAQQTGNQGSLPNVLICDPIHPDGVALLQRYAHVDVVQEDAGLNELELAEQIGQYQAVIIRNRTRLPATVIRRGENLQVIGRVSLEATSIDVPAARIMGIEVVNGADAHTIAVAEHTFALLLALARNVVQADHHVKAGKWDKSTLTGAGLAGKTLGMIGFDRVGRQVARRAKGFDMRVVVTQNRLAPESAICLGVEHLDLPDLLRRSDFVTLHIGMHTASLGLLDAEKLALMKPTAYLINTSRGDALDETALLEALEHDRLAGAGLDVFAGEPDVNPSLVRHPKVLATPHIGASTEDAQREAAVSVCEQIVNVLRRPRPAASLSLHVVPIEMVIPHENYHGQRVSDLASRLVADGRLVNPPVAARLNGRYIVLDGATRVTAFRHLGYPHIIIQSVDIDKQRVELHTWSHAVHGGSTKNLLKVLQEVPGLKMTLAPVNTLQNRLVGKGVLGYLVTADGQGFLLEASSQVAEDAADWLGVLNLLVEQYSEWGNVDRTLSTDLDVLKVQYRDLAALVVFPQFTLETIVRLAAQGHTLPAGITRFVIPGRILRLNAPLDKLSNGASLVAKRKWLDNLVQQKLRYRQVRYYEEPVVLLDE